MLFFNSATVDVKRPVCHLASDLNDRFIATIEVSFSLYIFISLLHYPRNSQYVFII